jgi:hypothetical protein
MSNHLLSQIIEHKIRPQHITLEILVLTWDRHTDVAGLNGLIISKFFPLDNWISNGNIDTYMNK